MEKVPIKLNNCTFHLRFLTVNLIIHFDILNGIGSSSIVHVSMEIFLVQVTFLNPLQFSFVSKLSIQICTDVIDLFSSSLLALSSRVKAKMLLLCIQKLTVITIKCTDLYLISNGVIWKHIIEKAYTVFGY